MKFTKSYLWNSLLSIPIALSLAHSYQPVLPILKLSDSWMFFLQVFSSHNLMSRLIFLSCILFNIFLPWQNCNNILLSALFCLASKALLTLPSFYPISLISHYSLACSHHWDWLIDFLCTLPTFRNTTPFALFLLLLESLIFPFFSNSLSFKS